MTTPIDPDAALPDERAEVLPGRPEADPEVASRRESPAFEIMERFGLLILLIGLSAGMIILGRPEEFRNIASWQTIAKSAAVLVVASLAILVPLVAGHFNLAVGATVGVSAIATASAYTDYNVPIGLAVLLGVGCGLVIGAVAGYLVAYVGVNSLITTLGIAIMLEGVLQWYAGSKQIFVQARTLLDLFSEEVPLIQMPSAVLISLGIAVIVWYILEQIPFGRYLAAIGSSAASARLVGIRVPRTVFLSFVLSGILGGLAGVLQLGSLGSAGASNFPGGGVPFILPALAAVFLGATTWKPGRFNVPGVIVAILLVKVATQAFSYAGVKGWIETVFNGAALVVAVVFSTLLARRRAGS